MAQKQLLHLVLGGELTAELGAHDQLEGAGSVTLRFAGIPVESGE